MRTVINNGHLIDPGSGISARLNVAIEGSRICEVTEGTLQGDLEIDVGAATYDEGFLERYGIDYGAIEIAEGEHRGERCTEALFRQLRKEAPRTLALAHVMNQADIDLALRHPRVIIASDGLINGRQGHPRAAGTFPRVLGEYVRERNILTLEQAIEKMTVLPNTIIDQSHFKDPLKPPIGIKAVFVNGKLASGQRIFTAAFIPRITGNLIDKVVSCLLVVMMLKYVPKELFTTKAIKNG